MGFQATELIGTHCLKDPRAVAAPKFPIVRLQRHALQHHRGTTVTYEGKCVPQTRHSASLLMFVFSQLIFSGGLLKDDLAPLSSYGLVNDAPESSSDSNARMSFWDTWSFRSTSTRKLKKLVMLGSKDVSARVDDRLATRSDLLRPGSEEIVPPKPQETEEQVVARIQETAKTKLAELEPMIQHVEKYITQESGDAPPKTSGPDEEATTPIPVETPNPRALIFLSEALLQALLKLDSIDIPGGYEQARAERKQGVKTLQAALDRVDELKPKFKSVGGGQKQSAAL